MTNQPQIKASDITLDKIEAGHIALGIWNGKSGAGAKFGVKHLYSDKYRELWPQDQYPEHYQEDVPVD